MEHNERLRAASASATSSELLVIMALKPESYICCVVLASSIVQGYTGNLHAVAVYISAELTCDISGSRKSTSLSLASLSLS
jgi:hypothetical protein